MDEAAWLGVLQEPRTSFRSGGRGRRKEARGPSASEVRGEWLQLDDCSAPPLSPPPLSHSLTRRSCFSCPSQPGQIRGEESRE